VRTAPAQGEAGGGAETVATTDSVHGRTAASFEGDGHDAQAVELRDFGLQDVAALFRIRRQV